MTLAGSPFSVAYPVKFYSEGDTTKEAFGKHIQEIERIYGLLNALNADKLSVDVFNQIHNDHVNSSNPHPNLDLANTKGNLATSRLSGTIPMSSITGNLNGSRITGNLANATIPSSNITGLGDFVQSQIPEPEPTEDGIQVTSDGAYMYAGDMLLQWGSVFLGDSSSASFKKEFTVNLPKAYKTVKIIGSNPEPAYKIITYANHWCDVAPREGAAAVNSTYRQKAKSFYVQANPNGGNTFYGEMYLVWHTFGLKE